MNCDCHWSRDRNNKFIEHILQLLEISQCDKKCECLLCEIIKNINCKCSCGNFSTNIDDCTDCDKKICSSCIKTESHCIKCFLEKTKKTET